MPTHCCGVDARRDRQNIGHERGGGSISNERGPARLQIKPLWRDVIGNEVRKRRDSGRPVPFSAPAAMQSRARQPHLAKQCVEYDGRAALASPTAAANITALSSVDPTFGLGFDNSLLGGGEQNLALGERQTEIFGAFDAFGERCDFSGADWRPVVVHDLKQNLHAHGAPSVGRNYVAEALRARMMV